VQKKTERGKTQERQSNWKTGVEKRRDQKRVPGGNQSNTTSVEIKREWWLKGGEGVSKEQ